MMLLINGIPLITLELKNAWTGQTARYQGQKQYREDRDANQPLLNFTRCLVHISMKQAIEEGFILDVLANYTTYKSYYEIEKSIAENPAFDTKKAQKKLKAYVESSQQTIDTKAGVMLEHFIPQIINKKKLKGKAKGLVITQNIETVIRYHKAINRILDAQGNPFKALVAFSGTKEVDGIEYTEAGINGFSDNDTKEMFDKKLASVLCVQALSRLNRSAPTLGKKQKMFLYWIFLIQRMISKRCLILSIRQRHFLRPLTLMYCMS